MAIITHELEHRGEDLKALRIGLIPLLRMIATGALHPQIVVMFAGTPSMIRDIAKLPYDAQEDIVAGKPYESPPPTVRTRSRSKQEKASLPTLQSVAENADHRDLGEMASSLILKSKKPDETLKCTLRELKGKLGAKANEAVKSALTFLTL